MSDTELAENLYERTRQILEDEGFHISRGRSRDEAYNDRANVYQLAFKMEASTFLVIFDCDDGEYVRIFYNVGGEWSADKGGLRAASYATQQVVSSVKCVKAEVREDNVDEHKLMLICSIETLIYKAEHLSVELIRRYAVLLMSGAREFNRQYRKIYDGEGA